MNTIAVTDAYRAYSRLGDDMVYLPSAKDAKEPTTAARIARIETEISNLADAFGFELVVKSQERNAA